MSGVNKVFIVGNLGKDPEIRYTQSGSAVASFSVATSESWKDKNTGEKKEVTEWHNITFFGKLAEICGEYLHKGSKVFIAGRLQTDKWQDKDGNDRYTTKIIGNEMQMLDSRNTSAEPQDQHNKDKSNGYQSEPAQGGGDFDDDIPFSSRHYLEG